MIKRMVAALALMGVGTVAFTTEANADTGCVPRTTSQAFAAFGDANWYFVAESGTFEYRTTGWTLGGSPTVVADQAPWRINGASNSRALRLPRGASAKLRMCVAENEDSIRFFYKPTGNLSRLRVDVGVEDVAAIVENRYEITTNATGWTVSDPHGFPSVRGANGQVWITITFTNRGTSAVLIDDVMIDPWISR